MRGHKLFQSRNKKWTTKVQTRSTSSRAPGNIEGAPGAKKAR